MNSLYVAAAELVNVINGLVAEQSTAQRQSAGQPTCCHGPECGLSSWARNCVTVTVSLSTCLSVIVVECGQPAVRLTACRWQDPSHKLCCDQRPTTRETHLLTDLLQTSKLIIEKLHQRNKIDDKIVRR